MTQQRRMNLSMSELNRILEEASEKGAALAIAQHKNDENRVAQEVSQMRKEIHDIGTVQQGIRSTLGKVAATAVRARLGADATALRRKLPCLYQT